MADGIIVVNDEGIIRFANPAAEQLFARSSNDLVGTYLGFPAVAGESTEIDVVQPHGDTVSVELRVVDLEWESQRAHLASLRDITDRRRAAERAAQLERERAARDEAEAASQAKSEFLAMMSHELRTPLNAIIGYADLLDLRLAGSLADEHRQQLVRIRDSAHHLLGLVNEVLDLAKGEAGRLSLTCGPAAAADVVDASLALVQPAAEARAIALSKVEDESEQPTTYHGDEDRVRQILVNLLTNAVKFTAAGGRVTLSYGRTDVPSPELQLPSASAWIYVRVADTGTGIPKEQLGRIFDPFMQVHTGHTRPTDGSGLGLTISRRLARMMHGDIAVQSELGKGSVFTLWLPAAEQAADGTSRVTPRSQPADVSLLGLAEIGIALQREQGEVLDAFVARLRDESLSPNIATLRFPQLADHLGTYLTTLSTTLMAVQDARGQPSNLIADGSDILRMLAERHGAQRQRLGWTSAALQREWQLLSDEVHRVVRDCARTVAEPALAEARMLIDRFVEQASEGSLRSFARAEAEERR
ncbi:MAG: sensor protein [Gemmatimonadetes bacterium]|nr:sensor protein [Gemmatimonadota bacterium]